MRMPALVSGNIFLKCTGSSHKRLEADDRIVAANAVLLAIADACLANPLKTDAGGRQYGRRRGSGAVGVMIFQFFRFFTHGRMHYCFHDVYLEI